MKKRSVFLVILFLVLIISLNQISSRTGIEIFGGEEDICQIENVIDDITVTITQGNLTNLSQLYDTNIPTPTDGHVLTWDAASQLWVSQAGASVSDTNETARMTYLVDVDCGAGYVVKGVYTNGTVLCVADADSGVANIFDQIVNTTSNVSFWHINVSAIYSLDWSNISHTYLYNQTSSPYFYNQTATIYFYNQTFIGSYNYNQTDTIYFYNMTVIGSGVNNHSAGITLNFTTLASYDWTNVSHEYLYNQTASAYFYNMTPSPYFYNQTFIGDYNYNQTDTIYFYNMTVIGSGVNNNSAGITLNFTTLSSYDWTNISHEYLYNQTVSAYFYNQTDSPLFYNQTFIGDYNYNQTDTVYFYNMTVIGAGISNNSAGIILNFTTLSSYDWSNISGEYWYNQTASPYFYNQTFIGNYNYNQTDTIYFYNMTVIGSGLTNNSAGVTLNFTTLSSYDWSNVSHEFLYNQTASAYFYNQTDTIYFYNQTVIGAGITNNSEGINLSFSTLYSYDWSNISGEYWYNQTASPLFYNQTASPYFYNQTATIYFYNMTVIGGGIENIFDQVVNTTSNVSFYHVNVSAIYSLDWSNISGEYWYNQTASPYFYNQTFIGDYNYNQTDTIYFYNMSDGAGGITNNTGGWNLNITKLWTTMFHTLTSNFEWTVTDDGSDMFVDFSEIGGVNSLFIETAGTFLEMVANPGPSNDYEMFAFEETQGADTAINFYEGGTGHNRIWSSGSVRIGGLKESVCTNLTADVDCDTSGTGADLVVEDDIWAGGKLFAYDWSNISGEYWYNQTASAYFYNQTFIGDYNYNQTASAYFYNQTISPYFYNQTFIGSYNYNQTASAYFYNQTASPYFYNQTSTIYFYNMTVLGTGIANSSAGISLNFTTLASYDWSNISGEYWYNQTASAYFYNQTDSVYFYNQTASAYFYNQTASTYFYNQTILDTTCNSSASCVSGGVAYIDYDNTGNFTITGNLTIEENVNITGNLTIGGSVFYYNGSDYIWN